MTMVFLANTNISEPIKDRGHGHTSTQTTNRRIRDRNLLLAEV